MYNPIKDNKWFWLDSKGCCRTREDLQTILGEHKDWIKSQHRNGRKADFTKAHLDYVPMMNAELTDAQLSGAYLNHANLVDGVLWGADLKGTVLTGADLTRASLNDTDLEDAIMDDADLYHTRFEPKSGPKTRAISAARHLEFVTYKNSPDALIQLRKQFQDSGLRDQERKISYAIKKTKTDWQWGNCRSQFTISDCFFASANFLFLDKTCQYGMDPWKPLELLFELMGACWVLYMLSMMSRGSSGIYVVEESGSQQKGEPSETKIRPRTVSRWSAKLLFFSLMTAFNIGYREFNIGEWLRILPTRELSFRARGWPRVVAGFQSLISVYLFVLFLLTLFGRLPD